MSLVKNLTIRQLTLYLALGLILSNTIVLLIFFFIAHIFESPIARFAVLIPATLINLFIIWYVVEKYVLRQIKILFKIIREVRLSRDEKKREDIGAYSLQNVGEEVETWAIDTRNELETMKTLEEYRKNYVGNISHELKTPIFSIQGYLHTLLEGGLYDREINKLYLEKAIKNLDRLQAIVMDLETISKIESEAEELEMNKFEIKALVNEIFEDLQSRAAEKHIQLGFKDNTASNFNVIGDREAIRQVLINLLVNSIKYGIQGGATKVSFYDMASQILVEVSDNGVGIEQKHLKHLFDRFYRVDLSRSRKEGGSGLGLSIVKHIIEAHKQNINVRSTPGLGTTFSFTLNKA